jgi:RNA polymerase sigma-70 factor (ECF subfamily)
MIDCPHAGAAAGTVSTPGQLRPQRRSWNFLLPSGVNSAGGTLEVFYENLLACQSSLYRYARSLSRDPITAEELVQEAFRRALSAKLRPSPLTQEAIRPWLFTVLRHIWHNEIRRRTRYNRALSALSEFELYPEPLEAQVTRRLLQSEVRQAIDSLGESYREVVVLRDIEGLSYAEIAAVLACPTGTVMSRLSRARDCLRQVLGGRDRSPRPVVE